MYKSFADPMNKVLIQHSVRTVTTFHRAQATPKGRQSAITNAYKLCVCSYATIPGTTTRKPEIEDDDSFFDEFIYNPVQNNPPDAAANKADGAHSTADAFTHSKTSDSIAISMNHFADVVAAAAKLSVPAVDKKSEKK